MTPFQRDLGLMFAGVFPDGDNRGEIETFVSRSGHVTDWHFDFMENFTYQLSGRKRWKIAPGPPAPLRGCTPHYKEEVGVVEMQAKIHKLRTERQCGEFKRQFPTPEDPSTWEEVCGARMHARAALSDCVDHFRKARRRTMLAPVTALSRWWSLNACACGSA